MGQAENTTASPNREDERTPFCVDLTDGQYAICREICLNDLEDLRSLDSGGKIEKHALTVVGNRIVILLRIGRHLPYAL